MNTFHGPRKGMSQPATGLKAGGRRAVYVVIESLTRGAIGETAAMAKAQHARRYRPLPPLLRLLRVQADLTQRELAARLKVSHVFVHKSEVGERRVDVTEFLDWCLACNVDPLRTLGELRKQRGI